GAVVAARASLDRDRLRGADRLAQLAGDAALLAVGIAAQHVLAAEARRDRAFLERIVERRLGLVEIAHRQGEGLHELLEERRLRGLIQSHLVSFRRARRARPSTAASSRRAAARQRRPPPWRARAAGTPSSPTASAGRSGSAGRKPS